MFRNFEIKKQEDKFSSLATKDFFDHYFVDFLSLSDLRNLCSVSPYLNKSITTYIQQPSPKLNPWSNAVLLLKGVAVELDEFAGQESIINVNDLSHTLASDAEIDQVRLYKNRIDFLLIYIEKRLIAILKTLKEKFHELPLKKETMENMGLMDELLQKLKSIPKAVEHFLKFNSLLTRYSFELYHPIHSELNILIDFFEKQFDLAFEYLIKHFHQAQDKAQQGLQILINLGFNIDKRYILPQLWKQKSEARYNENSLFNALGFAAVYNLPNLARFLVFNGASMSATSCIQFETHPYSLQYNSFQIACWKSHKPIAWLLFKRSSPDLDSISYAIKHSPKLLIATFRRCSKEFLKKNFQNIWHQAILESSLQTVKIVHQFLPANTPSEDLEWSLISTAIKNRSCNKLKPHDIITFLLDNQAPLTFEDFVSAVSSLDIRSVELLIHHGAHKLPTHRSGSFVNLLEPAVIQYSIAKNSFSRFLLGTSLNEERYDIIVKILNEAEKSLLEEKDQKSKADLSTSIPLHTSSILGTRMLP